MKRDFATIVVGILFLMAGAVIGGRMLGYFDFPINLAGWWTIFIIGPALISCAQNGVNIGNVTMLAVGVILLLDQQGVLPRGFSWKLILPGVLLLVGFRLIFGGNGTECGNGKTAKGTGGASRDREDSATANKTASSFFGDQNINYGDEEFAGGSYSAFFGSCTVNLARTRIAGDVVITVCALVGGIELVLPENVCVVSHVTPIVGGFDCKYPSSRDPLAPKVIVRGTATIGGVTVK